MRRYRNINPFDRRPLRRWSQTWLAYRIDCLIGGHLGKPGTICADCGKLRRR